MKFVLGDRAIVTSDCQTTGMVGEVVNINGYMVTLQFDDYLKRVYNDSNIQKVSNSDKPNIELDYVVVGIRHSNNSKIFNFKCYDKNVKFGDTVVCDTSSGFQTGKVVTVEYKMHDSLKEIVCIVDFSDFNHRKNVKERKESLKRELDKRSKAYERTLLYQIISENDEEFKKLLEEYNNL